MDGVEAHSLLNYKICIIFTIDRIATRPLLYRVSYIIFFFFTFSFDGKQCVQCYIVSSHIFVGWCADERNGFHLCCDYWEKKQQQQLHKIWIPSRSEYIKWRNFIVLFSMYFHHIEMLVCLFIIFQRFVNFGMLFTIPPSYLILFFQFKSSHHMVCTLHT